VSSSVSIWCVILTSCILIDFTCDRYAFTVIPAPPVDYSTAVLRRNKYPLYGVDTLTVKTPTACMPLSVLLRIDLKSYKIHNRTHPSIY
jgi:hypothetical protein